MSASAGRLVLFRVGRERFALPAAAVDEVVDRVAVQTLPGLPAHVRGVLRHRGDWVPAVDPAPLLGVPAGSGGHAVALACRRGGVRFALLADAVLGIRETGPAGAEATSDRPDRFPVILDDDGPITFVDPDQLFSAGLPAGWEEDSRMHATGSVPLRSIVVFRLGAEEFGLDVSNVHEVLPYRTPTVLPKAPRFIDGVLEVRGAVVPLIDLRVRFELPTRDTGPDTRIVIVSLEEERIGLVVDAVREVLRLPATAIAPPPEYFRGLAAEYLQGIARLDQRLILVLRMERVLTTRERLALAGAASAEPVLAGAAAESPRKGRPRKKP
ncbi:MAG: chemotaxis protein CheW [Gemmatimonadetes bacterium]|nr:chemotaxis protein CheW [Gemmatimonadota bacterium]